MDVFTQDAGEADRHVSLGEGGKVVRHDGFSEAESDVVFFLVGDDEEVPSGKKLAHGILGNLKAFFGELGFGKVDAEP